MLRLPKAYAPLVLEQPPGTALVDRYVRSWPEFVAALQDLRLGETSPTFEGSTGVGRRILICAPFDFLETVELGTDDSGLTIEFVGFSPIGGDVTLFKVTGTPTLRFVNVCTNSAFSGTLMSVSSGARPSLIFDGAYSARMQISGEDFYRLTLRDLVQCTGTITFTGVTSGRSSIGDVFSANLTLDLTANTSLLLMMSNCRLLALTTTSCTVRASSVVADAGTFPSSDGLFAACKFNTLTVTGNDNRFDSCRYTTLTDGGHMNSFGVRRVTKVLTATVSKTVTANTLTDVTGLTVPVKSGRYYRVQATLLVESSVATEGVRVELNGPTHSYYGAQIFMPQAASTVAGRNTTAYDAAAVNTAHPVANSEYVATINAVVVPSADGTLAVRYGSETTTSTTVSVRPGSSLTVEEIGPFL